MSSARGRSRGNWAARSKLVLVAGIEPYFKKPTNGTISGEAAFNLRNRLDGAEIVG
jgi:hypothetical protein